MCVSYSHLLLLLYFTYRLMKLPDDLLMDDVKEMELITRYLDPVLHPLFDDLDNDVIFRW